ncbi:hypothetical protein KKB69_02545 [Patescibacteria group bacterium]|nr:hypothetical protein [Patescibacteria group bacterium]
MNPEGPGIRRSKKNKIEKELAECRAGNHLFEEKLTGVLFLGRHKTGDKILGWCPVCGSIQVYQKCITGEIIMGPIVSSPKSLLNKK